MSIWHVDWCDLKQQLPVHHEVVADPPSPCFSSDFMIRQLHLQVDASTQLLAGQRTLCVNL
jgi:hypothetical protein